MTVIFPLAASGNAALMLAAVVAAHASGAGSSGAHGSQGADSRVSIEGVFCNGDQLTFDCDDYARRGAAQCSPVPQGEIRVVTKPGDESHAVANNEGRFKLDLKAFVPGATGFVEFRAEGRETLHLDGITKDACFKTGDHFFLIRLPSAECKKRQ